MLKEKIRESEKELTQVNCKWRNCYFLKSGGSTLGANLFPTQKDAENKVLENEDLAKKQESRDIYIPTEGGLVLQSAVAWHIQIPIMD